MRLYDVIMTVGTVVGMALVCVLARQYDLHWTLFLAVMAVIGVPVGWLVGVVASGLIAAVVRLCHSIREN